MVRVAENELQGVPARRKVEAGLGLSAPEMNVVPVGGDRLGEKQRLLHVDQEVMVPGIRSRIAGQRHPHVPQAELNHKGATKPRPIQG